MPKEKLSKIKVADIRNLIVATPSTIPQNAKIDKLLEKIIEDEKTRHVYVVDNDNKLIGSVRLNSVIDYMFPDGNDEQNIEAGINNLLFNLNPIIVKDIMNPKPKFVYDSTELTDIVNIMKSQKINEIPVVNENHKLIGEINFLEIIAGYLKQKNSI